MEGSRCMRVAEFPEVGGKAGGAHKGGGVVVSQPAAASLQALGSRRVRPLPREQARFPALRPAPASRLAHRDRCQRGRRPSPHSRSPLAGRGQVGPGRRRGRSRSAGSHRQRDFEEYWRYHLACEHQRLYPGVNPGAVRARRLTARLPRAGAPRRAPAGPPAVNTLNCGFAAASGEAPAWRRSPAGTEEPAPPSSRHCRQQTVALGNSRLVVANQMPATNLGASWTISREGR
jgi:hypothetical protein